VHSPEQHCELVEHGLPRVAHVALSAAHDPPTQLWLQHWPLVVQAAWSAVHAGCVQTFPVHEPPQQSLATAHADPNLRHVPFPVDPPVVRPPSPPVVSPPSPPVPGFIAPSGAFAVASMAPPPSTWGSLASSEPQPAMTDAQIAATAPTTWTKGW
jgi:hypothetical protein